MIFLALIGTVLLYLLIKLQLKKRRINKLIKNVRVKDQLPLFGIAHRFILKSTSGIMNELILMGNTMDTPSHFWFGWISVMFVTKPEDFQVILTSPNCLQKSSVYKFFESEYGLFASPAERWKGHRKLLNPTFNIKILHSFVPIFNEKTDILLENFEKMDTNVTFDISKPIFACTLDMICSTTMGYDAEVQRNQNRPFLESLEELSENIAYRMFNIWLHPNFIYYNTKHGKKLKTGRLNIENLGAEIRKIKEEYFLQNREILEKDIKDDENYKTPQIFVNELFKLYYSGQLDTESVKEEMLVMMVGGNETSALTMSNVILMLAMHPGVQEKVFQEIRGVYSEQVSYSDIDQISKLDYLEMVIKETMRLISVGPFLGRECQGPTKLDRCTIPAGTLLLMSFYTLHRDPKWWGPNSNNFDPDNFLPEKVKARHPYAYLPFSGGPRNCIGIKYAWISMKILLAALIRKYKFKTDLKYEELTPKWNITLKIAEKHMVRLEKREHY